MSNETGASAVDSTTSPANEHDYPSSASTPASSRSEPYLARSATSTGTAATPRESGQILGMGGEGKKIIFQIYKHVCLLLVCLESPTQLCYD